MTITPRPTRTIAAIGTGAVLALALVACTGSPSDEESAETTDSTAEATDAGTTEAGGDGDLARCILGTWEMDLDTIKEQLAGIVGDAGTITADGYSRVTIDPTTWTTDVDATSSFSVDSGGSTIEVSSVTRGSYVAEYVLEGDQLTQVAIVSAEGTAVTTIGGQEQVMNFDDAAGAAVGQPGTLTCDATTMTFSASVDGATPTQTFTRR